MQLWIDITKWNKDDYFGISVLMLILQIHRIINSLEKFTKENIIAVVLRKTNPLMQIMQLLPNTSQKNHLVDDIIM